MALIDKVNSKHISKSLPRQDSTIPLEVEIGNYRSNKAIRFYSIGSMNRQGNPKPSQVYVLEEKTARQLYNILKKTFGF